MYNYWSNISVTYPNWRTFLLVTFEASLVRIFSPRCISLLDKCWIKSFQSLYDCMSKDNPILWLLEARFIWPLIMFGNCTFRASLQIIPSVFRHKLVQRWLSRLYEHLALDRTRPSHFCSPFCHAFLPRSIPSNVRKWFSNGHILRIYWCFDYLNLCDAADRNGRAFSVPLVVILLTNHFALFLRSFSV